MKKICLISTVPMTVRSFLIPIARYYRQNTDWDISILCDYDPHLEQEMPEGVRYIPVSMRRGIDWSGPGIMLKMLKVFKREKFDMVQYCTPNASMYASTAARIAKIPVRLYCQWGMVYVSMKGLKRRIFKQIEKFTCRNSTWVEPDSFGNLEFAHQEGLYSEEKGSVVWNGSTGGIDLVRYDVTKKAAWREEIRAKHGVPQDAFVYGFVGRITGDKGINELYMAFRQLLKERPDAYLMMIGGAENEKTIREDLSQWANDEPHVVFCGSTNEIEKYFAALDVHVLPSYREGFGSVIIEAEAMEVPVIVTAIPGPLEAMHPGKTGLTVQKQDVETLLEAMVKLYDNDQLCKSLGKAGRQYVAERFEQQAFYMRTLRDRKNLLHQADRKKICFVTTVSITLKSFVVELAKYIHDHTDYDITFICNDDPAFVASLPAYIKFIPISMERGISISGIGAMLKMVKIFRQEKFDFVQYSTPNAGFYAALAAKFAGIKNRKYHLMGFRYLGFSGIQRCIFKGIERITCSLSTSVECVSRSNLEVGVSDGVFPNNQVQVIHYGSSAGINLSRFDISQKSVWREDLRKHYSIAEEDCVFGFAGRITRDKGINELMTAFETIPYINKKLVLIGTIEQEETLDPQLLHKARNNPHVIFIPSVSDIERYYAMMDVLVLPSYREGFGNVVIEAQALGVPVIVSDIPGPIDAMEAGVTGLVVSVGDVIALRMAMEMLLKDPAQRQKMGDAGYRLVSEKFEQNTLFAYILEDRRRLLGER